METLTMRRKGRDRLPIMVGIQRQELTRVPAAELPGLSYRQTRRVWRCYATQGDAGLVPRLRGRPSARRKPAARRDQVLAHYAEARYADFGPTLMAEQLAQEGLGVDHETVRRWALTSGQWTVRRRRQTHRQWREHKPCFGARVQLGGSHHDGFEGRRVTTSSRVAEAPEGWRTPRCFASAGSVCRTRQQSWTAAALCRFRPARISTCCGVRAVA